MGKTIVAYYSRAGTTKIVAEKLAELMHCDLAEITETKSRKGVFGFIRSGIEAVKKKLPPIILPEIKWDVYDLVIIGTPIWAGTLSSPVRSFLTHHLSKSSNYAIFYTCGGSETVNLVTEAAQIVGKDPLAQCGIIQKQIKINNWEKLLDPILKMNP